MDIFVISERPPATNPQIIIFRYFVPNASIHDLNRSYNRNFSKFEVFGESPECRYRIEVDLLDFATNQKYVHITSY